MTIIKLGDPKRIAYNNARQAFYAKRAKEVFNAEGLEISDAELSALAKMAWDCECGGVPPQQLFDGLKRTEIKINERISGDAKKIRNGYKKMVAAINDSHPWLIDEIVEKLDAKGVDAGNVDLMLEALGEALSEVVDTPRKKLKQGNTQKPRSSWVLLIWEGFRGQGVEMRKASRVIAFLFDGSYDNAESIYQAIRNQAIG